MSVKESTPEEVLAKISEVALGLAKGLELTKDARPTQAEELQGCALMCNEVAQRCMRMAPEPKPIVRSRLVLPSVH